MPLTALRRSPGAAAVGKLSKAFRGSSENRHLLLHESEDEDLCPVGMPLEVPAQASVEATPPETWQAFANAPIVEPAADSWDEAKAQEYTEAAAADAPKASTSLRVASMAAAAARQPAAAIGKVRSLGYRMRGVARDKLPQEGEPDSTAAQLVDSMSVREDLAPCPSNAGSGVAATAELSAAEVETAGALGSETTGSSAISEQSASDGAPATPDSFRREADTHEIETSGDNAASMPGDCAIAAAPAGEIDFAEDGEASVFEAPSAEVRAAATPEAKTADAGATDVSGSADAECGAEVAYTVRTRQLLSLCTPKSSIPSRRRRIGPAMRN